jgi:hypothetical protein
MIVLADFKCPRCGTVAAITTDADDGNHSLACPMCRVSLYDSDPELAALVERKCERVMIATGRFRHLAKFDGRRGYFVHQEPRALDGYFVGDDGTHVTVGEGNRARLTLVCNALLDDGQRPVLWTPPASTKR